MSAVLPHLVLLHMGALHPIEQWLTVILAFGPFLVLGIVVWLRRRQDAAVTQEDPGPVDPPSRTARG